MSQDGPKISDTIDPDCPRIYDWDGMRVEDWSGCGSMKAIIAEIIRRDGPILSVEQLCPHPDGCGC